MFKRNRRGVFKLIGNVKSICPNCDQKLSKRPGRKAKCPHCGNFIYVRTRPSDKKRVLVTEDQAEAIKEQWSIETGTHKQYLADKKRAATTKKKLEKKGIAATDRDVRFQELREDAVKHLSKRQMGLHRNAILGMAEIELKRGRTFASLAMYLLVSYIDLNGPVNSDSGNESCWNKDLAFSAPGVIGVAAELIKQLEYDKSKAREIFVRGAESLKNLRPPLSPSKAWKQFEQEVFE